MKKLAKLMERFGVENLRYLVNDEKVRADWSVLRKYLPLLMDNEENLEKEIKLDEINPAQEEAQHQAAVRSRMAMLDHTVNHKAVERGNLPYHTGDNRWLSKYVYQQMRDMKQPVAYGSVVKFVNESPEFIQSRLNYQHSLIKDQIKFMVEGGVNAIMTEQYRTDRIRIDNNCDELFYQSVKVAMQNLGIDARKAAVELEQNADLWRRPWMMTAFNNRYYPDQEKYEYFTDKDFQGEYRGAWLRLREYQYYQKHFREIDELGTATAAMKMSVDDAYNLTMKVANLYAHYTKTHERSQRTAKLRQLPGNEIFCGRGMC